MFTGVPNMAWVFGYFRASWTLRVDLVADFVCRLLNHMKQRGVRMVTPTLRPEDEDMPLLSWIDPENFNPGYVMRGMHLLPNAATSRNGSIPRTIGPRRTSFRPSTSTTARSFTGERKVAQWRTWSRSTPRRSSP